MKIPFAFLIIFTLTSCSLNNYERMSGKYYTKGGFEWGSSIWIKEDSTFSYKWQLGLIFGQTDGKWDIKMNKLILNSDLQPLMFPKPDFYILNCNNKNLDKITINLLWTDTTGGLIGAYGEMFYGGKRIDEQISDENGLIMFKKQDFDSIRVSFIGLKNVVLTNFNNDYYKILTTSVNEMYEYFTDETWKIRGSSLIDKTENKYYYEKKFRKIKN